VVLFSRRPVESPPYLTMGGIGLPISKEFKYLGVVFDRGLTRTLGMFLEDAKPESTL
jgi:hypothetical protein